MVPEVGIYAVLTFQMRPPLGVGSTLRCEYSARKHVVGVWRRTIRWRVGDPRPTVEQEERHGR